MTRARATSEQANYPLLRLVMQQLLQVAKLSGHACISTAINDSRDCTPREECMHSSSTTEVKRLPHHVDRQNYGHPEREEIPFRPLLRHSA